MSNPEAVIVDVSGVRHKLDTWHLRSLQGMDLAAGVRAKGSGPVHTGEGCWIKESELGSRSQAARSFKARSLNLNELRLALDTSR